MSNPCTDYDYDKRFVMSVEDRITLERAESVLNKVNIKRGIMPRATPPVTISRSVRRRRMKQKKK